ncbi:NAD-dependent epimerase/dehydratase family protein [Lignipirellula cremea]|uniref:NAD-dependent epimerase/dehydratase domain-containing protein n=1 Tax=Lignipirellula cremea TaxID=2528010 RepID=A0A518DUP9_9BACT|nr:NAD-dependent epimerase/dehydratase family protein [Lignipirellula cremea]QDU95548.1 hypothetical protein Pla8534_33630 [Lignipirellula cremea]
MTTLPETIATEEELDHLLSEPTPAAVAGLSQAPGDLLLLGAGGKMGLSQALMAKRAVDQLGDNRRIIAVSRFSDLAAREALQQHGIETLAGDLLDEDFVASLPDAPNVIHMTGMKFGSGAQPSLTWGTNVYMASLVARRFRHSRIAAYSTGNVYPLVPIDSGGSQETDPLAPIGEYAMTALGRERMFDFLSRRYSIPLALLRLNYAVELRYGVLVDIAQQVWAETPIDVSMGYANVIWQADACAMTLAALGETTSPPFVLNVAGPERLSIRETALQFGDLLGKRVEIVGQEQPSALLNNGEAGHRRFGSPRVTADQIIRWIAAWISSGGRLLGKPTRFEVRDGKF